MLIFFKQNKGTFIYSEMFLLLFEDVEGRVAPRGGNMGSFSIYYIDLPLFPRNASEQITLTFFFFKNISISIRNKNKCRSKLIIKKLLNSIFKGLSNEILQRGCCYFKIYIAGLLSSSGVNIECFSICRIG